MDTKLVKYNLEFRDLGVIDYKKAWDIQEEYLQFLVAEKEALKKANKVGMIPQKQVILFCEHHHVYTLGRSGEDNNLLINSEILKKINASYFKINRGGDITYHGPGQIVGYPIIDLETMKIKVRDYVWKLEETIIQLLAEFQITGGRLKGATGVWLDPDTSSKSRKICAIGVRVSNYVTMHGFALNINTNLDYFNYINPCGFADKSVTSLQKETGKKWDLENVKTVLKNKFAEIFNVEWLDR